MEDFAGQAAILVLEEKNLQKKAPKAE